MFLPQVLSVIYQFYHLSLWALLSLSNLILVVALALELWFTENCNVVLSFVNLEHPVLCH